MARTFKEKVMAYKVEYDKADECGVWLAAVLCYACVNFGLNRVSHAKLHSVVLKMSNDPTIPFTPLVSMRNSHGSMPPLPCFAEAMYEARKYGVDNDGEFAEFVVLDSMNSERHLISIMRKRGSGYFSVIARHARMLAELVAIPTFEEDVLIV